MTYLQKAPSMGGVAILAGIWAGYLGTHLVGLALGYLHAETRPTRENSTQAPEAGAATRS